MSSTNDMTKDVPIKVIIRFSIPLLIGTLFQQAYNIIDTMIAGYNLGDDAIAAIGTTSALYSVLVYFATGMNSGFGIILSQTFGAKDMKKMKKAVATMIILNTITTLLLTAIVLPFLRILLRWLDTPEEIFDMAYMYIFVILAGMFVTISYNMCAGFMRAIGNSRTPLYFLIISCMVNVCLDIIFIVVLSLGVIGVALATVIATTLSTILCMIYIAAKYKEYLPEKKDWHLSRNLTNEMLSAGISMGLMLSVFAIGSIILQKGINQLGKGIITAHTASRRIYEMLMMPLSTIATANATFVGQNFGAKQFERIKEAMKQVLWGELIWSMLSILIAFVFGNRLIQILIGTSNQDIISNAAFNLKVCTIFFFPLGYLLVLRNAMQAMGYKIAPVLSSSMELGVKVLSCIFVIPIMKYTGVVLTEPIIWVLCAVFLGIVYRQTKYKKMKV